MMVVLRYSAAKLYMGMALSGLACLFLLFAWIDTSRHFITAPIFFCISLVAMVNFALIASGDLSAVRATPEGLKVRAFWRMRFIPWSQLLRMRIEQRVYRRTIVHYLMFDLSDGGLGDSVPLNIQHTEADLDTLPGFIDTIEGQWQRAKTGGGTIPITAPAARGSTAAAALSVTPARPGFGRKGA